MIIENLSTFGNTKSHEILAHAQTISNFFIDALEQNDCNLKIVVGFYFDIDDTINTLEDIVEATVIRLDDLEKMKLKKGRPGDPNKSGDPSDIIVSPPGVEAAIQALKDRCFNCKLQLPKIKFEKDFRFTYNKLTFQLEIYKDVFNINMPKLVNYCHTSFALQKTCIPDLLKIIGLLLTALSAILALNRIPKISLGAFVKAIIGKLMAAVVANIKLSIDMSQTGVPCVLSAIEEIARAVPTKEEIYNLEMDDRIRDKLFPSEPYVGISGKVKQPFVPYSVFEQTQREKLRKKEITKSEYEKQLQDYRKANEPLRYYASQLRTQTEMYMDKGEDKISEAFGKVSDVVTKAQDDINSYIQSLLGVMEYFECENARTGPDFSDLISYINDLQTVINLFSSILGKWLTKMFDPLLCMDNISVDRIQEVINETVIPPLTNEDIADILEEFTGTETKLGSDGISVLLYDRPVKRMLPKLDLLGCNLKEFAEAHTIDNIIKAVVDNAVNSGDSSTRPDPYVAPRFNFPEISTIPRVVLDPPVVLPKPFYYKPIDVSIPPAGRSPVRAIPLRIIDRLRNSPKLPPGTKLLIPSFPSNILPSITTDLPVKPSYTFDPTLNNTPNMPDKVKKIVDAIKKGPTPINDDPYVVIDLGPGSDSSNLPDFRDELDTLLDFIYNPPSPDPEDPSPVSFLDTTAEDDSTEGVIRKSLRRQSEAASKTSYQKECKSFEDVMDILNTLRV